MPITDIGSSKSMYRPISYHVNTYIGTSADIGHISRYIVSADTNMPTLISMEATRYFLLLFVLIFRLSLFIFKLSSFGFHF